MRSLKKLIIEKAFAGHKNIWSNMIEKTDTGAPSSNAPVGTLCWNSYDSDAYISTVSSGTWVKINA